MGKLSSHKKTADEKFRRPHLSNTTLTGLLKEDEPQLNSLMVVLLIQNIEVVEERCAWTNTHPEGCTFKTGVHLHNNGTQFMDGTYWNTTVNFSFSQFQLEVCVFSL